MKRHVYEVSTIRRIVCPRCETGVLSPTGTLTARCGRGGFLASHGVLETLREIAALPDALGSHACDCGHPEMRRLPDGSFRCPACGAEVLSREPRERRERMSEIAEMTRAADKHIGTFGTGETKISRAGCGRRARRSGAPRPPAPLRPKPGAAASNASVLSDGQVIRVRAMFPRDANRLRRMFSRLSPTSIYRRFHSPLPRVPEWAVTEAVEVDHYDEESLVAVAGEEIVGQAMYVRLANGHEAEVAVVVEDGWQRRGVGKLLLSRLAEEARRRGIEAFTGTVLPDNGAMRGLMAASGGRLRYSGEDGACLADVPLPASSPVWRISDDGSGANALQRGSGNGRALEQRG